MKSVKYFAAIGILLIEGCATSERTRSISFGEVTLPTPNTNLSLQYSKDDFVILGDVNISKTFVHKKDESNHNNSSNSVAYRNIGQLATGVPVILSGNAKLQSGDQDNDISELIYEVYSKYQDIDYLVFPKIIFETIRTSDLNVNDTISATIKGTAVKLKIK